MQRLAALVLPLALAACDYDGEPHHPGDPAVPLLSVRTVPSTPPQPGDTLTFCALFPDSTSERYRIGWNLDPRGKAAPPHCPRLVCVRWIVPLGQGTYNHAIQVKSGVGGNLTPFITVVP